MRGIMNETIQKFISYFLRVRTPTPEPMKEETDDPESTLKEKDILSVQEASKGKIVDTLHLIFL